MPLTRRLDSFITSFVEATSPLGSPAIYRRWTAISIMAAALRQNVWLRTSGPVFPNLYIFLIGHPGVGKTRIISEGRRVAIKADGLNIAPVSMTFASMVDALAEAKVEIIRQPQGTIRYNSMYIAADELGTFMHKYEPEMIDGLSHFYDPNPYQQVRRTADIDIRIESPQINMIAGSTPKNFINFMPEKAWGQGFTSRIIMVFSDERFIIDDFADHGPSHTADFIADLKHISELYGQFTVTQPYREAINTWRHAGEPPLPSHPRLLHYLTRRCMHLYKLSMISSIDRDDSLWLTRADFDNALTWLTEAELYMPDIFKAGATNADAQAQDDIVHWIRITDLPGPNGKPLGISEQRITQYARDKVPIHSILRLIEILEQTGQIRMVRQDKRTGAKYYSAVTSPLY